jgi:O-antigen/teichoic acid export membrane protein
MEGRAMNETSTSPDESRKERLDRELMELLNEIRVTLPGVQVLFAFLLILPFDPGFRRVTDPQRDVYFATFMLAAFATVFLMVPTAYHRLRFRQGDKERMLRTANRFAIAGAACLGVAMGGAVYLVSDVLYGIGTAALVTASVVAVMAWAWFGLALVRRVRDGGVPPE